MKLILWLLFIVITILIALTLAGLTYEPPYKPVSLSKGLSIKNKLECSTNKVTCIDDSDCQDYCSDTHIELECTQLDRYTKSQNDNYGETKKYCLPKIPKPECGEKYGGIYVWTGWSGVGKSKDGETGHMDWSCLCSYPEYASSDNCTKLNPNICGGNSNSANFTWDATKGEPPSEKFCSCPKGFSKIISPNGLIPLCVPDANVPYYDHTYTASMKEGETIKCENDPNIYLHTNFSKRPYKNTDALNSWKKDNDNIITYSSDVCDKIPTGQQLDINQKLYNNAFIKCKDNQQTIFLYDLERNTRRPFSSEDVAKRYVRFTDRFNEYIMNGIDCSSMQMGNVINS